MDDKDFKQIDIDKNNIAKGDNLYTLYEDNHVKGFMDGNNVPFNVLSSIESYIITSKGVEIVVKAKSFINRHFWTHETMMNCLNEEEDSLIKYGFVKIDFFEDNIIKVRMNEGKVVNENIDLSNMPTQMLIGKADNSIIIETIEDDDCLLLKTNKVTIRIEKYPFLIKVYKPNGEIIFSEKGYETWISDSFRTSFAKKDNKSAIYETLTLDGGEKIYGLGERFDHIERTGKETDFWNKDAIGTTSKRTYINIPFYWSTKGYGLFLNNYGQIVWEIGTRDSGAITFGTDGDYMEYYIICDDSPVQILKKYAKLTGKAKMPPIWSFGLWMSRNSYMSWDVVDEVIADMDEKEIPFDVIHLDTAWFTDDWNCDLEFSKERFANPIEKISSLKEKGISISLWQYNFIPRKDNKNLKVAMENNYLAQGEDEKPYVYPEYVKGSWIDDAIIDFSNPQANKWYGDMIANLIKKGVGAIKTDFGEGIPTNAIYKNIDGKNFHNYYSLAYNHVIYNALQEVSKNTLVWARSGTAGSQRYPIHWGGDCQSNWAGLIGTMIGMLSVGLSGIIFFSHDIGGFIGRPTPELYIRWAQLGLFSSHSRCHGGGNTNSREPSSFGEQAAEVFKKYAILRYKLLPYIINQANKSVKESIPLARHLILEFPNDRNTFTIDDEYMFGSNLLIAPIVKPLNESKYRWVYLPECEAGWYDFHSNKEIKCGYSKVESIIDILPMYVKADAIIPYAKPRLRTFNKIGIIDKIYVYPKFNGLWQYNCDGSEIELEISEGKLINIKYNLDITPKVVFIK